MTDIIGYCETPPLRSHYQLTMLIFSVSLCARRPRRTTRQRRWRAHHRGRRVNKCAHRRAQDSDASIYLWQHNPVTQAGATQPEEGGPDVPRKCSSRISSSLCRGCAIFSQLAARHEHHDARGWWDRSTQIRRRFGQLRGVHVTRPRHNRPIHETGPSVLFFG